MTSQLRGTKRTFSVLSCNDAVDVCAPTKSLQDDVKMLLMFVEEKTTVAIKTMAQAKYDQLASLQSTMVQITDKCASIFSTPATTTQRIRVISTNKDQLACRVYLALYHLDEFATQLQTLYWSVVPFVATISTEVFNGMLKKQLIDIRTNCNILDALLVLVDDNISQTFKMEVLPLFDHICLRCFMMYKNADSLLV